MELLLLSSHANENLIALVVIVETAIKIELLLVKMVVMMQLLLGILLCLPVGIKRRA